MKSLSAPLLLAANTAHTFYDFLLIARLLNGLVDSKTYTNTNSIHIQCVLNSVAMTQRKCCFQLLACRTTIYYNERHCRCHSSSTVVAAIKYQAFFGLKVTRRTSILCSAQLHFFSLSVSLSATNPFSSDINIRLNEATCMCNMCKAPRAHSTTSVLSTDEHMHHYTQGITRSAVAYIVIYICKHIKSECAYARYMHK